MRKKTSYKSKLIQKSNEKHDIFEESFGILRGLFKRKFSDEGFENVYRASSKIFRGRGTNILAFRGMLTIL